MLSRFHLIPERNRRTDGWTDGQIYYINIARRAIKTMSMIAPVQSRCHDGSPVGKRSLRWEGFVENVGFESGVKE